MILDNVESVLEGGNTIKYKKEYEGYGELLRQIGETSSNSCLLLTTREKPPGIARLEGKSLPVRSFEPKGLEIVNAKKFCLKIGNLLGSEEDWKELIKIYKGNPLLLRLSVGHIEDVFFGNIAKFLKEGKTNFKDIDEILNWHLQRLSDLEKEVIYWLAINREPVSLSELQDDILSPESKEELTSTIQLLQRKIPLEKIAGCFTLQPVILEYVTTQLIEGLKEEIITKKIGLFNSHALLKSLAKDYVR